MEKITKYNDEKQWRHIFYGSIMCFGLGLGLSYRYIKLKPGDFSVNSISFALKALGIGTLFCFGTFGLGIAAISKILKIKNIDDFSCAMKKCAKKSFSKLKVRSNKTDHDNNHECSIYQESH